MSNGLRARAAVASIEIGLFAFNPHQRRGPDGRFIKMADSELKRPRRPRGRAARPEGKLYRTRREAYNDEVIAATESLRRFNDPERLPELEGIRSMAPGSERDTAIDRLAEEYNESIKRYGGALLPFSPPRDTGPREVAGPTAPATRPGLDAPYNRRRTALARSVRSGATGETMLAQGAMGETRRFELADGTSAVYKRATRDWDRGIRPTWTKKDQLDAEELSARVAAALGVPAPAVHRASEDEIYMEFMPGTDPEIRWPQRGGIPTRGVLLSPEGVRFGLLDTLIENTDRHAGNYLVDGDDHPVAIDHGMAFSNTYRMGADRQPRLATSGHNGATGEFALNSFIDFSAGYKPNPLTASDVAHVRRQLDRIRPEFERLGHDDWYQAMSRRLDRVAEAASGDTDIY